MQTSTSQWQCDRQSPAASCPITDTTVHQYVVSQIIKDFANNSHMQADGMLPVPAEFEKGFTCANYGVLLGPTYLRLRAGTNAGELEARLTETIHEKNKKIDNIIKNFPG